MARRAPGFIADGTAVDEDRARTEILAEAFDEAAGNYFKREVDYEQAIDEAEQAQDDAKSRAILAVVGGVVAFVFLFIIDVPLFGVLGLLAGVVIGYLKYKQYVEAVNREETNRENIRQNSPDGQVTFISQIAVPAYLVGYGERHMLFDGLNQAPTTELELAQIDGDQLLRSRDEFEQVTTVLDEATTGKGVLDPDLATTLAPGSSDHRHLEKPITDRIDQLTAIVRDVQTETVPVDVHANDDISRSMRSLCRQGLLESADGTPLVETRQSLAECEQKMDEIQGVEEEAISGDMLGQARESRQLVDDSTDSIERRLERNVETTTEHYENHARTVEDSVRKFVCEECLADRVADVDDELDLVAEVLSEETGSFGVALSDPDLDSDALTTDDGGRFTEQIRADIEEHLPTLQEAFKNAYNTLPDLGADGDYCLKHETVDTVRVARDGHLFAEVWRSLYYEFREPIMDSVEGLERDAEDVRQNKEQKMMDLAQYEQLKDAVERDYHSVKAEHQTADTIESRL